MTDGKYEWAAPVWCLRQYWKSGGKEENLEEKISKWPEIMDEKNKLETKEE